MGTHLPSTLGSAASWEKVATFSKVAYFRKSCFSIPGERLCYLVPDMAMPFL